MNGPDKEFCETSACLAATMAGPCIEKTTSSFLNGPCVESGSTLISPFCFGVAKLWLLILEQLV